MPTLEDVLTELAAAPPRRGKPADWESVGRVAALAEDSGPGRCLERRRRKETYGSHHVSP